jgi:hypothetical protein
MQTKLREPPRLAKVEQAHTGGWWRVQYLFIAGPIFRVVHVKN